jgi:hypothetical protein
MSSSNTSIADAIDNVNRNQSIFANCWSAFLLGFGIVGHSLNIYVFARPKLFSNPCARYFLASTIISYVILCGSIPLRLLQLGYSIDVFLTSVTMCKVLSYILGCVR